MALRPALLPRLQLRVLLATSALVLIGAGGGGAPTSRPGGAFSAEEWKPRQGKWRFEPSGEILCEGTSMSSVLYRRGFTARDLDFSVEVMFLGPESSAGLFLRAAGDSFYDSTTFYQFEWYTRGHHHDRRLSLLVKNPHWRWRQLVTPIVRDAPFNKWIVFRVRAVGTQLEGFIDGARVFSQRDRSYVRAGKAGLHVFQPRAVRFRNVQLRSLDGR
jgi:hypothetical protein